MKWTAGVRREVLPNGLTLLVQCDVSAPVAGVVTHVRAGFFDEPDRWQGISHVLEHMFFKGTPTRGVGAVARETRAAGGYLNAHTAYDHTAYFVVLPSGRIADALDIQSDALLHPLIDPAELARELQVIIQEAKRKLDTPDAVAHETLHEVLFDRHRIRRWRIGHEAQLAGFTADDVRGYYESRYVPGRTIIAIAGNVDADAALKLARRRYGDWPARPGAVDPSPEEPPRSDIRARTLRGDVAQAELVLGWRGVPPLDPEAPGLELAAAVLSLGRGSWLYRSLREPGIVTAIAAHHYAPTELGIFSVGAGLPAGNIEPAVRGVAEAVARLSLIGPTEADLERARRLLLMRWARRMESMDGRASALASAEALDGFEALDREYAALEAASAADVRNAAARRLLPDAVAAVGYLPAGERAEITSEMVAAAFAVTALTPLAPPSPENGAAPRRARQPAAGRTTAEVLHVPLDGADLLIRPKPGPPMVTLGIYAPRHRFDPRGQAGIAALAMRGALRGADGLDAAALAFAFERLGGSLSSSLSTDWVGLGATVLAERVPEAAQLLERIFSAPAHGGDAIEAERAILIAEAEQAADDMFRYPMQLAFAAAFNDQAYGVPVAGLPDTLPDISAEVVRRWYGDTVTAARPVVIAVGDLDPERAAADLSAAFEMLPTSRSAPRRDRDHGDGRRAESHAAGEGAIGLRHGVSRSAAGQSAPLRGRRMGGRGQRARGPALRSVTGPPLAGVHGVRNRLAAWARGRARLLYRHGAGAGGGSTGRDAQGAGAVRRDAGGRGRAQPGDAVPRWPGPSPAAERCICRRRNPGSVDDRRGVGRSGRPRRALSRRHGGGGPAARGGQSRSGAAFGRRGARITGGEPVTGPARAAHGSIGGAWLSGLNPIPTISPSGLNAQRS